MSANQSEIITGQEAAQILKCSYPYLYELIEAGALQRVEQRSLKGANAKRKPLRFRRSQVVQLARESGRLDESEDPESHARLIAS